MKHELTKIGYIAKAFGFKGELKCTLEVSILGNELPHFLWIYIEGKPVPFSVQEINTHNNTLVLKFEDVETEEEAQLLKNTSLFCEKSLFDTYFEKEESLEDLIGFTVLDKTKGNIGIVDSILENSIQPTLIIVFEEKEILIPYSEDIILEIDEDKKIIKINAPEGLIDLYLK